MNGYMYNIKNANTLRSNPKVLLASNDFRPFFIFNLG